MRQTVSAEPWLPGGGPAHRHLKARDGVHSSAGATQACTPDSTEMSVTLDIARRHAWGTRSLEPDGPTPHGGENTFLILKNTAL